ncbi:hypothetical protein [Streptomyces sp. NPDC048584]|uniref:hypothetical protein n=1 Tax=Streptomyces sp. NPDC048584 TaxID=3365573 RepID=UPI0037229FEC
MKKDLTELVTEFGLVPSGTLKEDLPAALTAHATTVPQTDQWQPLPKDLEARLPRLLAFVGKDESPDDAVRTALSSCYETHLEDETLQGQVREIEKEITQAGSWTAKTAPYAVPPPATAQPGQPTAADEQAAEAAHTRVQQSENKDKAALAQLNEQAATARGEAGGDTPLAALTAHRTTLEQQLGTGRHRAHPQHRNRTPGRRRRHLRQPAHAAKSSPTASRTPSKGTPHPPTASPTSPSTPAASRPPPP